MPNNNPLSRELYEQHLNASIALVDIRKLAKALGRKTATPLMDAIQAFVRDDIRCGACRGEGSVEHGDEWRICAECDGKGVDLSVRVPRLYDRYRDEGRKVVCSACLQLTHDEDACSYCAQRFVLAVPLEESLSLSLAKSSAPSTSRSAA